MRIGTYNVLGLKGYPPEESQKELDGSLGEKTAAKFAEVFSSLDCDILALQEGVAASQMQRVAAAMGMNVATIPSPVAWPGHVLSRYPILESRVFSHARENAGEYPLSRCAGAVLLESDDGPLWLVNVHLHPSRRELRDAESETLRDRVDELAKVTNNVIVVGDFNSEVDEAFHGELRSRGFVNAMERVGGGIEATMDTVGINTHYIDHIVVSAEPAPRLSSAKVVRDEGFRHDGPQAPGLWVYSDHLPVVAELD